MDKLTVSIIVVFIFMQSKTSFSQNLPDVIVTAQKYEQTIQRVGLSIDAFTGDELDDAGIHDLRTLGEIIPGLDIKSTEGDQNQIITIRGIGLRAATPNVSPSTGVHVDGVSMATPAFLSFPLFDIERVEVLKGPQGTLYGKNTTAGTINFINKKPS